MAALIPDDLAELFEGGVSILVGTRDAGLVAEATRGVGAVVHPDRRRLTVFLPVSVSDRAIANLGDNGSLAVGFSSMLDHRTLQVKGKVEAIRDATEAEREIVSRYHAAFGEVLFIVGIPRVISRALNVWPCHAVTFEATDIFLQTPGPNAGERISA
ncbi:MAG TPA: hypothetical protein VM925_11855 [Labilithrix sp.]|jgi:hypothetical protein|nr:hypothetical protein [Labilithrix sp.]